MPEEKMVSEWALEWLEKQMQRGLSQNTEGSYRQWICKRIVPEFSDVTLAELTEEHVQHFYESLAYEGLSRNSIWCGHLILRRLLDEAGREGMQPCFCPSHSALPQQELIGNHGRTVGRVILGETVRIPFRFPLSPLGAAALPLPDLVNCWFGLLAHQW